MAEHEVNRRYLVGTVRRRIFFEREKDPSLRLRAYCDADYAGERTDQIPPQVLSCFLVSCNSLDLREASVGNHVYSGSRVDGVSING